MKKVGSFRSLSFYFAVVGKTGYVLVVDDFKITFDHSLGGGMTGGEKFVEEVFNTCTQERAVCERIIICSLESEDMCRRLGVDTSMYRMHMSEAEIEEIQKLVSSHFQPAIDEFKQRYMEARKQNELAQFVRSRTEEVVRLLNEFRYADAREHCEIYGLDYSQLVSVTKKSP